MTNGNIKEFNELFDRLRNKKGDFHFGFLTWEDIKVNVLTHVYNKYHLFDQSKEFGPWVNKIIHRQVMNYMRNACYNNIREAKAFSAYSGNFQWISDMNNDPIGDFSSRESLETLRQVFKEWIASLRYSDKKLLINHLKNKITYQALSPINDLNRRTLYMRVDKAKAKLLKIASKHNLHIRTGK